jgi:UDP-N-acetylglucosamine transferase subunit ALG13
MATPRAGKRASLCGSRNLIFVTVGAQMPFDRLIRAVDEWAYSRGKRSDIFAQIGTSDYQAKAIEVARFLDPLEFRRRVEAANVIVAHAGMGSIITALEYNKSIVVMPRRAELRETRNDHQVATAARLSQKHNITVANDQFHLLQILDQLHLLPTTERIESSASLELIANIHHFIEENSTIRRKQKNLS